MDVRTATEDTKQIQDDFPKRRKRHAKQRSYNCLYCQYESNRPFNVERHKERIHRNKNLHHCCGQLFFTKGNYYIHCEKYHPERRTNAITTQTKYRITSDSVPTMQPVYDDDLGDSYKWQFEPRYSERIREKKQRKVLTRMSLTYELTYTDRDMENIPLICFLTDRRLKLYMKRLSASSLISKTGEKSDGDANRAANNAAVPTDRDVEETSVSEENVAQETSNCCKLPVKKLLLNRFRGNASRKFQIPFRQQNNNYPGQVNFAEATATESVSVRQNWSANRKRGSNKENVSTFAFSFEQQLHVDLDTGITGPVVSELHRDFLAAIDFDKYKIF